MSARAGLVVLVAAGGLLASACPARTGATPAASAPDGEVAPAQRCDSVGGELPSGATMRGASGRYALTLRATSGPASGGVTQATLWLEPSSRSTTGRVAYPLVGRSDLRPDAVGAHVAGDAASRDPERPGVLVLEYPRAGAANGVRDVILRFGSESNRSALAAERFDGAYLVLQLQSLSADRFAGTWRSGLEGGEAGGVFCAARVGER